MARRTAGFSLIELLVVFTVLGVLATIAIPRLRYTRERAVRATMLSDLKNIVALQEAHFSAVNDYAGGLTDGPDVVVKGAAGRISFRPSQGNEIALTRRGPNNANGPGWSATAKNPRVTTKSYDVCGIYIGSRKYAPNGAVPGPGIPTCY